MAVRSPQRDLGEVEDGQGNPLHAWPLETGSRCPHRRSRGSRFQHHRAVRCARSPSADATHVFAGSERGAPNWACLASLLNTWKSNYIDPLTWLTDVLERIVSGRTNNDQLHELLLGIWKAARATPSLEAAA